RFVLGAISNVGPGQDVLSIRARSRTKSNLVLNRIGGTFLRPSRGRGISLRKQQTIARKRETKCRHENECYPNARGHKHNKLRSIEPRTTVSIPQRVVNAASTAC